MSFSMVKGPEDEESKRRRRKRARARRRREQGEDSEISEDSMEDLVSSDLDQSSLMDHDEVDNNARRMTQPAKTTGSSLHQKNFSIDTDTILKNANINLNDSMASDGTKAGKNLLPLP